MGALVAFDRRSRDTVELPAYRLAEAGMEVAAVAREVTTILRAFAPPRDRYALRKLERAVALALSLEAEGRRIAGWAGGPDGPQPVEVAA